MVSIGDNMRKQRDRIEIENDIKYGYIDKNIDAITNNQKLIIELLLDIRDF